MRDTLCVAAEETRAKAAATCSTRGDEYQDSWGLDNLTTPFLDNLLAHFGDTDFTPQEKRLILCAAIIDVKLCRLGGEYKEDTVVDLINYAAAYNTFRNEYDGTATPLPQSPGKETLPTAEQAEQQRLAVARATAKSILERFTGGNQTSPNSSPRERDFILRNPNPWNY